MSEEEIINVITKMLEKNDDIFEETGNHLYFSKMTAETIQGLLDLYNKEKEKNKELEMQLLEKDLHIDGLKEDRRIAIEELQEEILQENENLKADIKNMYHEEVVLNILENELDISRNEAIDILQNY